MIKRILCLALLTLTQNIFSMQESKTDIDNKFMELVSEDIPNLEKIKEFLAMQNFDLNRPDWQGRPIFIWCRHIPTLEFLLNHGANVNAMCSGCFEGMSVVQFIAKNQCMGKVNNDHFEFIVKNGANVNYFDPNSNGESGLTPLMLAVKGSSFDRLKILLDNGADVNLKAVNGMTPLMMAASKQHCKEIINLLLEKGADINAKNTDGKTAKDIAIDMQAKYHTAHLTVKLLEEYAAKS